MIKRLAVLILALVLLVPLVAACGSAGPAGAPGSAGSPGPAGSAGPAGEPVAPAASILVTPASGKAATPITITGAGFVPGEEVDLVIKILDLEHIIGAKTGPIVANEYGAFVTKTNIPNLPPPPGAYAMEARGDKGTTAFHPLVVTE